MRRYNFTSEDLTVTFDSVNAEAKSTASNGCEIKRDEDGFYHLSPGEWEGVRGRSGVKLIEGAEW